jgi:hypothetical protein
MSTVDFFIVEQDGSLRLITDESAILENIPTSFPSPEIERRVVPHRKQINTVVRSLGGFRPEQLELVTETSYSRCSRGHNAFPHAEQLRTIEDADSLSILGRCSRSLQRLNPATTLGRFREEVLAAVEVWRRSSHSTYWTWGARVLISARMIVPSLDMLSDLPVKPVNQWIAHSRTSRIRSPFETASWRL